MRTIGSLAWAEYVRNEVSNALVMARSQKVASLDVELCLAVVPPSKFLSVLWQELVTNAAIGDVENCRRLATFVLIFPQSHRRPPLLPIFLHTALPSLIRDIDQREGTELSLIQELVVGVIMTVLTAAMHLELALSSVHGEDHTATGQPSAALARKLALDLRAQRSSPTSLIILDRLGSSQSFVGNFPVFLGDKGT